MEIIEKRHDDLVTGAEVWFVRSVHVDDVFRVTISWNTPPPENALAPLVIATDAELTAGFLAGTLTSGAGAVGLDLPPVCGVSVGYPLDADPPFVLRRNRDLTPSVWPEFARVTPAMLGRDGDAVTGGARAYLDFLVDELRPELAANLPVDPDDSTLAGVSFGGLFTLAALLERPGAFRRYLAESPSLFWGGGVLLDRAREAATAGGAPDAHVYLCVGELEHKARFRTQFGPVWDLLPAAMKTGDMQGDLFMMEQILREWGVRVEAHIFPEESHESLLGAAFSRGLRRLHGTL
jgi:uncharacterized protein